VGTLYSAFRGVVDLDRWSDTSNLHESWEGRTQLIATMIPDGVRVTEFGAGRLVLRTLLPSSVRYTPSDIVSRSSDTIVCDLNEPLPDFPDQDVAVFSGVIEYVRDVPGLARSLQKWFPEVIVSYAPVAGFSVRNWFYRRRVGWMHDMSEQALLAAFKDGGYECSEIRLWANQRIYRFVRNGRPGAASANGSR
ncbi:MAG TPA: hypothetical protein VM580_25150, partial [Labilithrix sp.]|nr:hypothetical protein [Labilithrix sp.]